MMDDISSYNRERWNALARANALFTRPALHLDTDSAREKIDPEERLGELAGKQVLCLAGGGGQQSLCRISAWFSVKLPASYATEAFITSNLPIHFLVGWLLKIGTATDIP